MVAITNSPNDAEAIIAITRGWVDSQSPDTIDHLDFELLYSALTDTHRIMSEAGIPERRIRLGRFAVDYDLLVAGWASDDVDNQTLSSVFWARCQDAGGDEMHMSVVAELEHWKREINYWVNDQDFMLERLRLIALIESRPVSHHDFIALGIVDFDEIEGYLSAGVDMELVLSTAASVR